MIVGWARSIQQARKSGECRGMKDEKVYDRVKLTLISAPREGVYRPCSGEVSGDENTRQSTGILPKGIN